MIEIDKKSKITEHSSEFVVKLIISLKIGLNRLLPTKSINKKQKRNEI